ncbi:MAG: hypothetical protein K0S33_1207 [Bacteroidetes bacterium]|nr:hypothetical protein [Bacteroidota bacterium]
MHPRVKETFVDIFGIHIQEPVTIFTNLLITLTGVCMYFKLRRHAPKATLNRYWRLFFLFFGLNAAVGFITHGFKSYFAGEAFYYVFLCMNLASVPITFFLLKADVENTELKQDVKKNLNIVIFVASAIFVIITVLTNTFGVVKISAGISILTTIVVHMYTQRKGYAGSGDIAFGFGFSILALIVHGARLSVSEWFNFKDISHVIMIISLFLIYKGVVKRVGIKKEAIHGVPSSESGN